MEKHIEDLSKYRFNKANDCLNIAKKLFEGGELGYAQNRAYYAVFDAIRSITVLDGFDSSKHSLYPDIEHFFERLLRIIRIWRGDEDVARVLLVQVIAFERYAAKPAIFDHFRHSQSDIFKAIRYNDNFRFRIELR